MSISNAKSAQGKINCNKVSNLNILSCCKSKKMFDLINSKYFTF